MCQPQWALCRQQWRYKVGLNQPQVVLPPQFATPSLNASFYICLSTGLTKSFVVFSKQLCINIVYKNANIDAVHVFRMPDLFFQSARQNVPIVAWLTRVTVRALVRRVGPATTALVRSNLFAYSFSLINFSNCVYHISLIVENSN